MLSALKDYILRIAKDWVALMTGIASLVLAVLGAWRPPSDNGRTYLFAAAGACFLITSFSVWLKERNERLKLERECGPRILLRISTIRNAGETIEFVNEGDDTALNVELDSEETEDLRPLLSPWRIPFVQAGASQSIFGNFYRLIGPTTSETEPLVDFLRRKPDGLRIYVSFENSRGAKFKRWFTVQRVAITNEIQCFAGKRETADAKRKR